MVRKSLLLSAYIGISLSAYAAGQEVGAPDVASDASGLNQSVSIEEPAPKGPAEIPPEQLAAQTVPPALPESVNPANDRPSRPSTILGKKREASIFQAAATDAQTPWYRTGFGALGIVLAVIGALYLGLKRWAPSIRSSESSPVRVVARTVIGPRQSVVLMQIGRRMVLVGVSPDRIDCVCEIADADEVASLSAQTAASETRNPFSSWLDREAAQYVAESKSESDGDAAVERGATPAVGRLLHKLRATKV